MAWQKTDGWYVISMRPQGGHAALRRAAARLGARTIALSPWRIRARDDAPTRQSLADALQADRVLFTSPAAVDAAARLMPLRAHPDQAWLAVGSGTANALRRQGIDRVTFPSRMDSEGLLALPMLQALHGTSLGFVTAPEGRNLLAPTLAARGAHLLRAEVYERQDVPLPARALDAVRHASPACVLITSGGALERVLAALPPDSREAFTTHVAVVASERLAEQARQAGFRRVVQAAGPRHAQMVNAAADAMRRRDPLA